MQLTPHPIETAREGSQPLPEKSHKAWRMPPNLHAVMAERSQSLQAYQDLHQLPTHISLTAEELSSAWLTVSTANECHYCVPAHTTIAYMEGLEQGLIDALRSGDSLADAKLESLRQFPLTLVKKNGQGAGEEQSVFLDSGYKPKHAFEPLAGITQKPLSNFVNHVAETPLDDISKKYAWTISVTSEVESVS